VTGLATELARTGPGMRRVQRGTRVP